MIERIGQLFTPTERSRADGLVSLIVSDYLAYYHPNEMRVRRGVAGSSRRDSPRRLALLFLPRMLLNPSLHATVLIRLAMRSPRWTFGLWRTVLIAKHSIDISAGTRIGAGFALLHPHGITLGWGLAIGNDVTILHHNTIGGSVGRVKDGRASPVIGDDVVVYGHSMIFGPITIGDRAVVGAGSWVDHDLAADEMHRGLGPRLRRYEQTAIAETGTAQPPAIE